MSCASCSLVQSLCGWKMVGTGSLLCWTVRGMPALHLYLLVPRFKIITQRTLQCVPLFSERLLVLQATRAPGQT